jgi:hypothetical protein
MLPSDLFGRLLEPLLKHARQIAAKVRIVSSWLSLRMRGMTSRVRKSLLSFRSALGHRRVRRALTKFLSSTMPGRQPTVASMCILVPIPGINPCLLTRPELYLDSGMLDRHYRETTTPLGAIDPRWGSRFSRKVAKSIAVRFGKACNKDLQIDPSLATKAWFFAIWAEVCVAIPARHLARRLVRLAGKDLIIIPLASTKFKYLGYWDANEIEPFYLAAALSRLGARVVFALTDRDPVPAPQLPDSLVLEFSPHWLCFPKTTAMEPEPIAEKSQPVLVPAGIRGVERFLASRSRPLTIEATFAAPLNFDAGLTPGEPRAPAVTVHFKKKLLTGRQGDVAIFCAQSDAARFVELLVSIVGEPTRAAAERANYLVERHCITEAYVCDHLFFESAVMAHAVRERGGEVILLPHSSNAVHTEMYEQGEVSRIHCTTSSAATTWATRLPDVPSEVNSQFMFKPCSEPRHLTPSFSLTVVIIGGAHDLGRMPLLDRRLHEQSYRDFFRGLRFLEPEIRVLFKPKWIWETGPWLREIVGADIEFEEISIPPSDLDEPNMIYVTISFGSTALLEGLSRGIPCMIVRDFPVEDYTGINSPSVPIGDVETIIAQIRQCQDSCELNALTRRELAWYEQETNFP